MRRLLHILSGLALLMAGWGCAADGPTGLSGTTRPIRAGDIGSGPVMPGKIRGVGNFAEVAPGLYRGEQPTAEGFAELEKMGIKTVVNLRLWHGDGELMKGTGLQYVRIPTTPMSVGDREAKAFLKVVADPANRPVFVHCQHGADRTGCMVAVYRIVKQGWSVEEAVAEMRGFGFHRIWVGIPAYLERFEGKSSD